MRLCVYSIVSIISYPKAVQRTQDEGGRALRFLGNGLGSLVRHSGSFLSDMSRLSRTLIRRPCTLASAGHTFSSWRSFLVWHIKGRSLLCDFPRAQLGEASVDLFWIFAHLMS